MVCRKLGQLLFAGVLVIVAGVFWPAQAHAWFGKSHHGRDRGYPHHDRYPYGQLSVSLPHGFMEISLGSHKYFYNSGLFYRQNARQYVIVPPPTGVVVYGIPEGYHQVQIDGVVYYAYNGIYYTKHLQGYQVVDPPPAVIVEPARVVASVGMEKAQAQEDFTINIPNAKGNGYVSVVIKRSGNGYVGPQGEFYSEFPKVTQLQAMYAK